STRRSSRRCSRRAVAPPAAAAELHQVERSAAIDGMIRAIRADYRETARWTGRDAPPERVLDALRRVPRDAFVPTDEQPAAWHDRALAIGHGQTISQPFVVALTTDLLEVAPGQRVLEIGTGSGYQ